MGKTAVLKSLLPLLDQSGESPCVCKIDCLQSKDAVTFQKMKYPCVTGLSGDICPDHFLVSNLPELWQWTDAMQRNLLVIETAGLCHRCSPATKHMLAGCVVDCTVSCKAPGQLGPMLTQADFVVLTKVDMISQAEMEIICWQIGQINPQAKIFPVDALAGYGTLLQVCYAIAIGFLFTIIFYKGKSLLPCIIAHSFVNSSSVFAVENSSMKFHIISSAVLCIISLSYALWILKKTKQFDEYENNDRR